MNASGPFQVTMHAEPPYSVEDGVALGRARFDKRFEGALDAKSEVQMLSVRTADLRSGAYVAIERITGTLGARRGSFVVTHHGVMDAGAQSLAISIAPGSGTGELAGISGRMHIRIEPGGSHFYEIEYELP